MACWTHFVSWSNLASVLQPPKKDHYDRLLEDATGLPSYTWLDQHQAWVQEIVRGNKKGVFHIHGVWDRTGVSRLQFRVLRPIKNGFAHESDSRRSALSRRLFLLVAEPGDGRSPFLPPYGLVTRLILKKSPSRSYFLCLNDECPQFFAGDG